MREYLQKSKKNILKIKLKDLKNTLILKDGSMRLYPEIASGVNENRRGLLKLLNKIKRGEVKKVVIEYPDRLARFGFKYLKFFMESFGVELIILNDRENENDTNKELAEDLIAIVTSFAARIYGQRGGKKYDSNTS